MLIVTAMVVHLGFAAFLFLTIDMDFGKGSLRHALHRAIDFYEWVGFDVDMALGVAVVSAVLTAALTFTIRAGRGAQAVSARRGSSVAEFDMRI